MTVHTAQIFLVAGNIKIKTADVETVILRTEGVVEKNMTPQLWIRRGVAMVTGQKLRSFFSQKEPFTLVCIVPHHVHLQVRLRAGNVSIHGVYGSVQARVFAGNIALSLTGIKQAGNVDTRVAFGDVFVSLGRAVHPIDSWCNRERKKVLLLPHGSLVRARTLLGDVSVTTTAALGI